ncbi:MAG: NADH:flavin oxidoreductase [Thermodesulfobacteriota bacterium]
MGFEHLLSPIKVGPLTLKNRMALAPMNTCMSGLHGEVTEQLLAYYGARAKGGAGLIITEVILGTRLAAQFPVTRDLALFHPGHAHGLSLLVDRIHYFGADACAQMSIGLGRQSTPLDPDLEPPAATGGLPYEIVYEKMPDAIAAAWRSSEFARTLGVGRMTREMSLPEIRREQKEFAFSCQLAVAAGFDAIEIHATHGFLLHQFLSPFTNRRSDLYGGEWRNRKRFLNEVCEQVRYACPGVALGVRFSAEEHFEGGLTRAEMMDVAKDLEARGADYLHLSDGGGFEESGHQIPDADRAAHIPEHGADFKKTVSIPVMVASQHDPLTADQDIAAGKFDLSALGRQLLCDPEYPKKLMEGRADQIVKCVRCNICLMKGLAGNTAACPLNPLLGREYGLDEYRIGPYQAHESIIPKSWLVAPMPALDRPWWKPELDVPEKYWRPFRGPGPR